MSWTNSLKLTLESNAVVAGLQAITNAGNRAAGAVGGVATAAVNAGSRMAGAFRGFTDILWKLPDQVRALQGMLNGLSLPSKLAGSMETTKVAFSVLVGSADKAEQVLGRIQALAASTPFEFAELADGARMLAAFNEEADSIPETLRRIGDIASVTGVRVSELAEIYGKARVAGRLYAEDINQLMGRGIPVMEEFAKILGVSEDKMKDLVSEGKVTFGTLEQAFKNLTDDGGKFGGMMAAISETFEGKLSTLGDSFKTLLGKLGEGVNEGLKPIFDELTRVLDGQQGLAKSIGEELGYGLEVAMAAIKDGSVGEILAASFDVATNRLRDGFKNAIDYFLDNFPEFWNPVEMGKALGKRAGENAMRPVGLENKYDAISSSTREAEQRLENALRRPKATVDKNRDFRQAGEELEAPVQGVKNWFYKVKGRLDENRKERDGFRKQAESDYYNMYEAPTVPQEGRGGKPSSAKRELMDRLFPDMPEGGGGGGGKGTGKTGPGTSDMGGGMDAGGDTGTGGSEPGRRRIKGVVLPGSFQWQGGRKVPYTGGNGGEADRMAGMGNGQQRARSAEQQGADMAAKAAAIVVKLLPEIARDIKQTARK